MTVRIIAKLDVKPPYVVKPVHFEGLRKMGNPSELAKKYYDQGADELFYIDIVSSLYQREILFNEIEKVANELFIPFAAGGGVKNIDDFSKMFHMGADKVVINTYAIQEDPNIIDIAAKIFGSQAVVINIEAKKWNDSWECYTDCGRIQSGKDVLEWVKEVEKRGAGEILLQSVDSDGRRRGFDIELAKEVVSLVKIPVVVSSGAGSLEDIKPYLNINERQASNE
jgi:imidazole glycerol-phosphate synthase subunit HisF